ncbi:hypothetical protein NCH01_03540 [Neoasaia chiangmaiensis]|nr:TetR family transcriptional regulator [Neoasaia chiangmaiensis]GEN13923.1 hypothetical protein NCH01_03540 [Neoasaia chiangmaiensis]
MDATTETLIEFGYQATSMDRIAHSSGMSKKTLYQMFSSKQELLEALLTERLFNTRLSSLPLIGETAEARLVYGMQRLTDEFLRDDRICLLRVVVTEVSRIPEIGDFMQTYFTSNSRSFPLYIWLRQLEDEKLIVLNDLEADADRLFGMTIGLLTIKELTRCKPRLSNCERASHIIESVRFFLRACSQSAPRHVSAA